MCIKSFFMLVLVLLSGTGSTLAQQWSIPSKSLDIQMGSIVFLETHYPKPGAFKINDTLNGTGFLIADSGKIYLVTAKHLLIEQLVGKNQTRISKAITIKGTWIKTAKSFKLRAPVPVWNKDYLFSSDKLDIAIISLKRYPVVLTGLLKQGCQPIPIDSIDTENDRYVDEAYYHPAYLVYPKKWGEKAVSKGLAPGKIKAFDDKQQTYTIAEYIRPTSTGSPLYVNNRIIGMVLNQSNFTSNAGIIKEPYKADESAIVVKASFIIPLLRKLQLQESVLSRKP